ncbi:sushi domain-containing protein 4 isoform X5 [Lynx canadensis]|uniref:sushi domain-containing protein 4 isoform X5 n=1 Tax=Lynx canadensis TaxID=61383 RepID=UPI0013C454E2|nr:sushi domain-containing protein 4 isoform X5 [Lynx canadensis]
MHHGMKPSPGDGCLEWQQPPPPPPPPPRRLLAAVLWFQLALCFGPAQLTGGFDGLQACTDPGVPENGFRTPSGGVFPESSVTQFHCEDGFKLKGSTKRLCARHPNGTLGWIPSDKPVCAREDCRVPQVEDAEIRNKTYRHGDKLIVTCHEGFKIRYPDLHNMVSLCRDDGTWDNLPLCQVSSPQEEHGSAGPLFPPVEPLKAARGPMVAADATPDPNQRLRGGPSSLLCDALCPGCLRPLSSSNGYVNISEFQTSFPVGTVISYHCFPGFKLEGSEYLECLHNLIWSSSPPRCLALEVCPLPPTVSHGDFVCHPRPCERYNHGTVVEFYCDPGYSLTSDYKYITCQYGEWFPSYQVYCIKSVDACRTRRCNCRANVAQHSRDPPDHVEGRGVHGDQRAAGAAAGHPGQDVPDQVQGPFPCQGASPELQQRPGLRGGGRGSRHASVL